MADDPGKNNSGAKPIGTIKCLLCGSNQIYPGPRYQNHLINEHGAVFDVEFLIKITLYKKEHEDKLPEFQENNVNNIVEAKEDSDIKVKVETSEVEIQTEEDQLEQMCVKCQQPMSNGFDDYADDDEQYDEVMGRLVMDMEEEDEEIDLTGQNEIKVWICPVCPHVFKRHSHFKTHASSAHDIMQNDIESITPVTMTEEEFLKRQAENDDEDMNGLDENGLNKPYHHHQGMDKAKRKPIGKEWGPNSFSSTFTCYFCNEQFRKDYRLKLHLMLNHKTEPKEEMDKAKEVLTKAKLDGCVHRCALCGSKYNSVANFTRHIKDVHQITRAQYRSKYGSSEVVSRMFKCELCDKEVKHTRNIIGAHMKMVHLISWKEYQEILVKIRQGETVGDLPAPELFECMICGVSVKYKREHLNKKHQITEDVYDELIAKKSRGEDISDVLPEREIFKCLICDRECMDIKKHIERSHQLTEDMYEEMVASKTGDTKRVIKQLNLENNEISSVIAAKKQFQRQSYELNPMDSESSGGTSSPNMFLNSSSSASNNFALSTDLQCYFGCDESFKKDYQLHLHLKLKHRNEDPEELAKAYEAAEEEIALTRRSASIFNCALCPKTFNDNGAFYGHIQTKHNMVWREYKEQYGRCEVESAPFECKICGRVVKYDRNTVHTHLKNVHGINWAMYLDRIRRMRRGEIPEDLPAPETHECRVCNVSVKYLKEHLKNAHKITEQEYESLFEENNTFDQAPAMASTPTMGSLSKMTTLPRPPPLTPKPKIKAIPQQQQQPPPPSPQSLLLPQPQAFVAVQVHDPSLPKPPKLDIQDKTNKTCSVCNIAFASRRSFIEHCTTVHNMRFKTKSGATINGSTVQKRLQEEALKRSAEQQQQQQAMQQQPPLKKLKTEDLNGIQMKPGGVQQSLDDGTVILESGRRTLYTPSGVSRWNQCKYECCFCKRTTMSRSSMTSHIHNTHGIPIKEYKESNYPDIEVETNWFQCRLCPARTKFVKDCIAPHLKMSHNMDIEDYERNIMQPEDWPYEVIPEPSLKHEMRKNNNKVPKMKNPMMPRAHSSNNAVAMTPLEPLQETSSERDKWNRCKFACGLCDLVTVDSRQMRLHIATHHGFSMDAYTKQYGTTEIVSRKFRCEFCNSEMKFCRQNIYAHMKDVHKITLVDYEAKIGVQARDIIPVEEQIDSGNNITPPPRGRKRKNLASMPIPSPPVMQMMEEDDQNEEIVLDGIDPTTAAMPANVQNSDDYIDSGLLDDGKQPSRWNKCRFRCAICGKLSSEKRHIREHIIKFHGMSLPEYESEYGDCEIHTEYFFCGVCHAEVKHNLKNISLHLQNVHKMSPSEYELQYGVIPESEDLVMNDQHQDIQAADYGFGDHFLLDNNVESYDDPLEYAKPMIVDAPKMKSVPNPPRSDIVNAKNKFCKPCGRDFNRRQAFVEHCRTVHGMKIRFAKAPTNSTLIKPKLNSKSASSPMSSVISPTKPTSPGNGSPASGYPCQYCGKLFSNQSNRRRHAVLSCDMARDAGVEPRKSRDDKKSSSGSKHEDFYYEDGAPGSMSKTTEQKCPFPDCDVVHLRSALMKKHLNEVHYAALGADFDNKKVVKSEPSDMLEIEQHDVSGDDRKVPPLRVKISKVISKKEPKEPKEAKPYATCPICHQFKSNNLYILGRHQKSCEKKMEAKQQQLEQTLEDQEQEQNEGDTTIEVPVDFEQENTEEDEEVYEPPMSEINDEKHETSIELKEEINATIEDDDDDDDDDDAPALCINEDVEDEPEENDISSESEQQVEMFAQNEEGETKNGVEIEKKVDIAITNNVKNIQDDSMTGNEQQQLPSELNNVDHETSAKKETEVPITKRNNSMSITEEENLDPVVEEKEKNHDE